VATSIPESNVAELTEAFLEAPADSLEASYQRLVGSLWAAGELTSLAESAVPQLMAGLDQADGVKKGYLAILLGLIAEAEYPDTESATAAAVRKGLSRYLDLWAQTRKGQPLRLALQYLLSHFPGDRDRILAVAAGLELDRDDASRLDRALRGVGSSSDTILGRVFPYPAAWLDMGGSQSDFDQAWIRSLSPEEATRQWHKDTRTVMGFTGAKAYWAVGHGIPSPPVAETDPPRVARPPEAGAEIFGRHAAAFRCPNCRGRLNFLGDEAQCADCAATYPISKGMIDLIKRADGGHAGDFMFQLSQASDMGLFLEMYARPNFKRLCGFTWDGLVTSAYENGYIASHVVPVDGPVLDIAAGAGGWTMQLASMFGPERVIALDIVPAVLATLRHRLPEVPAVIGNALALPFGDSTLGAAICWNGPQAFVADTPAVFAEVGRCLRPGGTFSIFTFLNSDDPVYRHFVGSHFFPQASGGMRLFDIDDLRKYLREAGLSMCEERTVGLATFITAEKIR